jgi:hypothetical protein
VLLSSNEAVEKLLEGSRSTFFEGHSTLPGHPIAAYGPFYEVGFLERPSVFSRFEFFYSFNVELTGAARLYRAASSDRRERG